MNALAMEIIRQEAQRAKNSFHYYVRKAWQIVEPASPFIDNWHIGLVCEYLEALNTLQIQNLIINIPPGHAKSLLCSVMYPTWTWTHTAQARFLCGSYASDLAVRDATRSRDLIKSDWYQARFGDCFRMTSDQNVKSRYVNDKTGHRISIGADSGVTGHRGDYIVWDDPLDVKKAESKAVRKRANDAVLGSMATRGNKPKEVRRLLIMQRLHDDDPTGKLLEKMEENEDFPQFEHLVLPARYEPHRFVSGIDLPDPRKDKGELLFPQLFDEKAVRQIEALLGKRKAAGELQQRPAPEGGAIYLREWYSGKNRYDSTDRSIFNKIVARWLSWDTANKDGEEHDYTGLTVWDLLPDYRILLRYAWWKKLQFPQLSSAIEAEARRWNYDEKLRGILIEDRASGTQALQTLGQAASDGVSSLLIAYNPPGSKPARARSASLWCERGCVLLPNPSETVPWLYDYEEMLFKFPTAKIKDVVDSTSQAILYMENLLAEGWQLRTGNRL